MNDFLLAVKAIRSGWHTSWFKGFLSRYTVLGKYFETNPVDEKALLSYKFMDAYLNSSPFFRWWFKSYIKFFPWQFNEVCEASKALGWMFNETNFNTLINFPEPQELADRILMLKRAGILTQNNFNVLADAKKEFQNLHGLFSVFKQVNFRLRLTVDLAVVNLDRLKDITNLGSFLLKTYFFPKQKFNELVDHPNLEEIISGLRSLDEAGILTKKNFNAVVRHSDPIHFALALGLLYKARILTSKIQQDFEANPNLKNVAKAISTLNYYDAVTQDNFNAIAGHVDPGSLAKVLGLLHSEWIEITPEILKFVSEHSDIKNLSIALNSMKLTDSPNPDPIYFSKLNIYGGLLNKNEFKFVANHSKLKGIASVLKFLRDSHESLLSSKNFNQLFDPAYEVLLNSNIQEILWDPLHRVTLDTYDWECILQAAKEPNPEEAFKILAEEIRECKLTVSDTPYNKYRTHDHDKNGKLYLDQYEGLEGITDLLANTICVQCETFLAAANEGSFEDKDKLCALINGLKNSQKAPQIYVEFLSKEDFLVKLEEKIKLEYPKLKVSTYALKKAIRYFKENRLTNLPPLNLDPEPEHDYRQGCYIQPSFLRRYSAEFLKFDAARAAFEATEIPTTTSAPKKSELSQHSLFSTPILTVEPDVESSVPKSKV